MSDPFKDALRKSSQKLNCCCDTGLVCPTHGAMGKTSDAPETEIYAAHKNDAYEFADPEWDWVVPAESARSLERQRNEARKEVANWKQFYAEAVERGRLFQSQRDEARKENARLLALLREVRFVAYQPPLVREMISDLTP